MADDEIVIEDLPGTVLPNLDHSLPAMREGLTVKLTVAQIIGLIRANLITWDDPTLYPTADNLLEVLQAFKTADDATLALLADPWRFQPIGGLVALQTDITGVTAPPTNQSYRYAKLTAGLTGVGNYNNGVLGSESVSGSAPSVVASATVTLSGSPINGQVLRLINSERRFLRSGSAGTLEDSANLAHNHGVTDPGHTHLPNFSGTGLAFNTGGGYWRLLGGVTSDGLNAELVNSASFTGISIQNNGGTEARPRNIGTDYYMRVK